MKGPLGVKPELQCAARGGAERRDPLRAGRGSAHRLQQHEQPGSAGLSENLLELLRRRVCVFIDGLEEAPGGLGELAKTQWPLFGGPLEESKWKFVVCI
eukprot:gene8014-11257_t